MINFFNTIVTEPLYNILIAAYDLIPPYDFGIAIIVTTIIIKLALLRLSHKQIATQKKMQEIQPEIKKLQKKYKDDKERQAKEMFALYKKHGTTPFSGCLPIIVQIIVFIGFYRVLLGMTDKTVTVDTSLLYSFVPNPGTITPALFGIDLHNPSIPLAILAAAAQYWQMKMMLAKRQQGQAQNPKPKKSAKKDSDSAPDMSDFAEIMTKQMLYIGPILTLMIGFTFPGGLALYWFVSTFFMVLQQYWIFWRDKKFPDKKVSA